MIQHNSNVQATRQACFPWCINGHRSITPGADHRIKSRSLRTKKSIHGYSHYSQCFADFGRNFCYNKVTNCMPYRPISLIFAPDITSFKKHLNRSWSHCISFWDRFKGHCSQFVFFLCWHLCLYQNLEFPRIFEGPAVSNSRYKDPISNPNRVYASNSRYKHSIQKVPSNLTCVKPGV
jgi:hypothetical protein